MTDTVSPEAELGRPLAGLRVIDCSRVLAGPFCGSILADFGADVVRVEHPTPKDEVRVWQPARNGYSAAFLAVNHSKRSLALDLSRPQGAAILRRLLEQADVLIENFRPGTLERYGIDMAALRHDNPRLIHCAVRAFPAGCAAEGLPGYEASIQAYSGIMSVTGEHDGRPVRCGASVVDLSTGLMSVIAVLSALRDRDRTGRGQYVEPALLRTASNLLAYQIAGYHLDGSMPQRRGSGHDMLVPYRAFDCADGPLFIAAGNDRLWGLLCDVLKLRDANNAVPLPALKERLANRAAVDTMVETATRGWNRLALMEALKAIGIPSAPVNTIADYVADETLRSAGVLDAIAVPELGEITLAGRLFGGEAPPPRRRPAPRIGEHSDAILKAFGVDDREVAELKREGIVR
jgi:crotonobetainyl-CoA:carnitine CoA-transferase CaiB-like acyl-CoA transferase